MELVVLDFVDPVATVVILECQDSPISLSQIPDTHCTVRSTGSQRVESTLVVCKVKDLVIVR